MTQPAPTNDQRRRPRRRVITNLVLVGGLVLLLTACAAGANPTTDVPAPDGDVAGFWLGLWHGVIVPFTFLVSLFSDTVGIYESHNTGSWYDFGFVLGAGTFLGSGGAGAKRKR